MRGRRNRVLAAGFTLIELMIVVVIMGVLAAVAVVSYRIYIQRGRISEAAGLLADIKGQQESYRAEFRMYCNVNTTTATGDPTGCFLSEGGPWTTGNYTATWNQLGFTPDTLRIGFCLNTIAGLPANPATVANWDTVAGYPVTLPVALGDFTADHWFIARALGNQDDDTVYSVFWITNMTTAVAYRNETE